MSPLELAIESFSCPSKAFKKSPELFRNHLSNYGSIIKDLAEKGAEVNVICKVIFVFLLLSIKFFFEIQSGESCMIEFLQKIEKLKIEEFLPDLDDFYKIRELMMSVCSALVSRGSDLTRFSKTEDTALNYFAFFGFCELMGECPEILFEVKLSIKLANTLSRYFYFLIFIFLEIQQTGLELLAFCRSNWPI